ncbi:MAG: Uma2 family endonuclease [Bythopirellula sp.]|nr:Uma2 family endonuclease [Bythopirellula sp.]
MATDNLNYESFTGFSPYATVGPYRADDYWILPENEPVQLLRGRLIVSPSPNILHQLIVMRLGELFSAIADQTDGFSVVAPMDTVLSEHTIPQPDVIYVRSANKEIIEDRVRGVPDLVIEVLSPSTARVDRLEKMDLYAQYGIAEYWIVDPESHVFEFLILKDGSYSEETAQSDHYISSQFPEVVIDLAEFWQVVDRRNPYH